MANCRASWSTLLQVLESTMTSVKEVLHGASRLSDQIDTRPRPLAVANTASAVGVGEGEHLALHVVLADHRGRAQVGPSLGLVEVTRPRSHRARAICLAEASRADLVAASMSSVGCSALPKFIVITFTPVSVDAAGDGGRHERHAVGGEAGGRDRERDPHIQLVAGCDALASGPWRWPWRGARWRRGRRGRRSRCRGRSSARRSVRSRRR